ISSRVSVGAAVAAPDAVWGSAGSSRAWQKSAGASLKVTARIDSRTASLLGRQVVATYSLIASRWNEVGTRYSSSTGQPSRKARRSYVSFERFVSRVRTKRV